MLDKLSPELFEAIVARLAPENTARFALTHTRARTAVRTILVRTVGDALAVVFAFHTKALEKPGVTNIHQLFPRSIPASIRIRTSLVNTNDEHPGALRELMYELEVDGALLSVEHVFYRKKWRINIMIRLTNLTTVRLAFLGRYTDSHVEGVLMRGRSSAFRTALIEMVYQRFKIQVQEVTVRNYWSC